MIFLASFLGGAAKRYSRNLDDQREAQAASAAKKEQRAYESAVARREALLQSERDRLEYVRQRQLNRQESRLREAREIAVQGVKGDTQTGVAQIKAEATTTAARTRAGATTTAAKTRAEATTGAATIGATGRADVAERQIEGRATEGQADREVKVDIAALESADREARDELYAEIEREKMDNALALANAKRRSEALLRAAKKAPFQYALFPMGETDEDEMEHLLRGEFTSGKAGFAKGNSEQLLMELNKKLDDPEMFRRVQQKLQADPDFKREFISEVNSLATDYYHKSKSISQNGTVTFQTIFYPPSQTNGVDKKGFGNIGKLEGVRGRYWREVGRDMTQSGASIEDGRISVDVNNSGTSIIRPAPNASSNVQAITNPTIRAKLKANNISDENLSLITVGEYNSYAKDNNMIVYSSQTDEDSNSANRKLAAEEFRKTHLSKGLQNTEKVVSKAASLYSFFKQTAPRSKPIAPRTRSQNMQAMLESGSASTLPTKAFGLDPARSKQLILGRARYLGAQNLSRTLLKLEELERQDAGTGYVTSIKAFFEGALGSTGQVNQIIGLMSSQKTQAGDSIYQISSAFSNSRNYVNFDETPSGVKAAIKLKLIDLAAYQMATTYQSAADKITDADVRNFKKMLTDKMGSSESFLFAIRNFKEDSNFQLFKNYGFSVGPTEPDYPSAMAALKLEKFADEFANSSALQAITSAKMGGDPTQPAAAAPSAEQQIVSALFDRFKPARDLQSFGPAFLRTVKAVVANQKITGSNAIQTDAIVGDNSTVTLVGSIPLKNQDALLIHSKVTKDNNPPFDHFFKLRYEIDRGKFKPYIENITPEDVSPQSNAMGGVISSFAKSVAARK